MIRINVGCGKTPTNGWRNFDNSPSLRLARYPRLAAIAAKLGFVNERQIEFIRFAREHAIEFGDAARGLPLEAGTVDVIYTSHMLEHLDRADAERFLRAATRLLRPGGTIRIAVPDLKKLVDAYVASGDGDAFMSASYLAEPRPKRLIPRLASVIIGERNHQWMYDGRSLSALLVRAGFVDARILLPGETGIERPGELDLRERERDSLYVEARRV